MCLPAIVSIPTFAVEVRGQDIFVKGSERSSQLKKQRNVKMFDSKEIARDFPILSREIDGHKLVYLDNAATSQKPRAP